MVPFLKNGPFEKGRCLKWGIHPAKRGSNPVCILEAGGCIYGMKEIRVHILPGIMEQLSSQNHVKQK